MQAKCASLRSCCEKLLPTAERQKSDTIRAFIKAATGAHNCRTARGWLPQCSAQLGATRPIWALSRSRFNRLVPLVSDFIRTPPIGVPARKEKKSWKAKHKLSGRWPTRANPLPLSAITIFRRDSLCRTSVARGWRWWSPWGGSCGGVLIRMFTSHQRATHGVAALYGRISECYPHAVSYVSFGSSGASLRYKLQF